MFIRQISVFLENTPGSLAKLTGLLGEAGIDLIAMSIADTEQYGILRCIVANPDACVRALRDAGYIVRLTEVVGVCVPDCPGGLARILNVLTDAGVSVEYLYSFVRRAEGNAMLIFHLSDGEKGAEALLRQGVKLLDDKRLGEL